MADRAGKKITEGMIADYWLEDGILVSDSKSVKRTVELIKENVVLVKEITGNKPVPLLIYLSKSSVPDKERMDFSAKMLPELYTSVAMVIEARAVKIHHEYPVRIKAAADPDEKFYR